VNELNHRVKNTLAVVLAISAQTRATATSPEACDRAFAGRLQALARAHDLLTREDWEGAPLAEVVQAALKPYGVERCFIRGPSVWLAPGEAVTMTLAFQELATNAAKYGALSTTAGSVHLSWEADAEGVNLQWLEKGGRPVAPPTRRGFGFRLIERIIPYELGGKTEFAFEREGLACRMVLPRSDKVGSRH
jgi:two-component sensor histidine kinase